MEMVTAEGEIARFSREKDGDVFDGMVVALGALGTVTQLTLRILPTFSVRQQVYERLPFQSVENHFGEIMSAAYSVSLFTDWQSGLGKSGLVEIQGGWRWRE